MFQNIQWLGNDRFVGQMGYFKDSTKMSCFFGRFSNKNKVKV